MLTSSIFGGSITAVIPNGATGKSVSASTNGVVLDVQESGVFSIYSSKSNTFNLSIEVDGIEFSGSFSQIIFAMVSAHDGGSLIYASGIPFYKSLKITIINHSIGTLNIERVSL